MTDIAQTILPARLVDLGLSVRPFRDATDYASIATLMGLCNAVDGIPWLPTEENIRSEFDGADGVDPATDIVLVEDAAGLVAFAAVERVVRDDAPNYDLWGFVHPDRRRNGLGGALFERNLRRIAERIDVEDPDPTTDVLLRAHVEERELGHAALLTADGFAPARHYLLMRRAALDDVPDVPLPDGLELRTVTPGDHRAIWEGEAEAFQDHWGAYRPTEHDFQRTFSQSTLDTDLWAVAWDGDQVAGVVQTWIWAEENERLGVRRGWLEKISVRRPWRKRGLGRALTAAALRNLHAAGMTDAMLGVDSQNPTGALGLYERLGFEAWQRSAAWQRPFDRAGSNGARSDPTRSDGV